MVVGDFNGDGRSDLAVTDANSGDVLIFLGLGRRDLREPGWLRRRGKAPCSPIVGDFNHDGILDIAVADTNSNEVSVLYRSGATGPSGPPVRLSGRPGTASRSGRSAGISGQWPTYDLGTVNRTSHDNTVIADRTSPDGNFKTETINYNLPGITPIGRWSPATSTAMAHPTIIFIDEREQRRLCRN